MSDVLILTLFSLLPIDADNNNALEESEATKWKKFASLNYSMEESYLLTRNIRNTLDYCMNLGSVSVITHLECICYSS